MDPAIHETLRNARDRGLTETNAQGVFLSLKELRTADSIHRARWIWELIQNAADATDSSAGSNRVGIKYSDRKLEFSHVGAPFTPSQIFHLIYHGSTKQEADLEKVRFGTGFLTIHLLSPSVRVSGQLLNGLDRSQFSFMLNREGDEPSDIRERMDRAWEEFGASLAPTALLTGPTVYECDIDERTAELLQTGIAQLESAAPYILAFVPELAEITVESPSRTCTWRKLPPRSEGVLTTTQITKAAGGDVEEYTVAVVGDLRTSIGLAVRLQRTSPDGWVLCNDSEIPRLFYPLPLVATADLGFPFVLVSACFEPREKRDGIHAGKLKDDDNITARNWQLLRQVPSLYHTLLSAGVASQWGGLNKLLAVRMPAPKEWLDQDLLQTEVLLPIVQFVRSDNGLTIIDGRGEARLSPTQFVVPERNYVGTLLPVMSRLPEVAKLLPAEGILDFCIALIEGWAAIEGRLPSSYSQCWLPESLGKLVSIKLTIEQLAQSLGGTVDVFEWLNSAYHAAGGELAKLAQTYPCLPNQRGVFRLERELQWDDVVDEELKGVANALGEDLHGVLVDRRVAPVAACLFQNMRGRTLTVDDAVGRCLQRVTGSNSRNDIDASARLIEWLVKTGRLEKAQGIKVACISGTKLLTAEAGLLAPANAWRASASPFADLWESDRRIHEGYSARVTNDSWDRLAVRGLVKTSLLVTEVIENLNQSQTDSELGDGDHNLTPSVKVLQVYRYSSAGGIRERASKSKKTALSLFRFTLEHLIHEDPRWADPIHAECSCGKSHSIAPAWLTSLRTTQWICVARNHSDTPNAKSLASIIDAETKDKLLRGDDVLATFMLKLGVGISDILRNDLSDESKLRCDRLSAGIYSKADDPEITAGIDALLHDSALAKMVLERKRESERVLRNQAIGSKVEQIIQASLAAADIAVVRTGVGSDYEVASDYIADGQQQLLKIGSTRFLVEIKSTSEQFVRMTLVQGKRACEEVHRTGYTLCIVPFVPPDPDIEWVRAHVRFIVGMFPFLHAPVADAERLKVEESVVLDANEGSVQLDFEKSTIKLKVHSTIWESNGFGFDEFVSLVLKK